MTIPLPRPDLEAHDRAMRVRFATIAKELRDLLGARLAAHLGGVKETRAVHEWAEGNRRPNGLVQRRLRLALQVATMIAEIDGSIVAQSWFQGLNPRLDDRSPARLLREGDLDEVGPLVVAAARAFLFGG